MVLDGKELVSRQGFGDEDVEGRHFASKGDLVVSLLLLDEAEDVLLVLMLFECMVEGIDWVRKGILLVFSLRQTASVIFSISSLILKGDSGPLMNSSIMRGLMLLRVCWAMLMAKVAVCL